MNTISKSDILTIRITPYMRMQLEDIAKETGNNISTITKAAIDKMLSYVYGPDGSYRKFRNHFDTIRLKR